MVVSTVTFVEEVDGQQRVVEEQLSTSEFAVEVDGQLFSPAVTTEVEMENDGDSQLTKDQCGNGERTSLGDSGWQVTVKGIVTANEDRHGNLSLQLLRDVVAAMDEITIVSDIASGTFVLSNVVITDPNDLVSITTADTNGEESAYDFQLQLGRTTTS